MGRVDSGLSNWVLDLGVHKHQNFQAKALEEENDLNTQVGGRDEHVLFRQPSDSQLKGILETVGDEADNQAIIHRALPRFKT